MAAKKNYWFKSKNNGWGWGLPLSWQGWASFGLFIAIWLFALYTYVYVDGEAGVNNSLATFISIMAIDILALVYVSYKYGEPATKVKATVAKPKVKAVKTTVAKKPAAKKPVKKTTKRK